MAKTDAVWGIDIGQCALKALRCRPHDEANRVTADAFDYIEYPKILSQPDVDPAELVREALKQFLSRNSVRGDRVVISVSGQSGLARFIKLPPVEAKKIPDIVKYEARQQIPFALEDVVWDYQTMIGGSVVEGFAMETEVGLFAMKRDQVFRALKPFHDAGIEVDIVQLTPLALYNFVAFDQMEGLPPPDEYDPDSPPESVVLISLGTDTTDLVVTNGFRVWQRNIPIGGNHFTKALTKELKLTFASAEHLKRNATQAEDPKALFQAMRPVFNDLLTEVQRSISFFTNLDRKAKIGRALAMGNAMKLPGLQRYLAQNLGFELTRLESFRGLSGSAVVDAPAFKENLLAFGVCYGLTLQALRETRVKTNLLPRELALDRLVREKRPWAVGAAAALLLGCGISFVATWMAANSVAMEGYFKPAVDKSKTVVDTAKRYADEYKTSKDKYGKTVETGEGFIQNVIGRDVWLKVMKGIDLCLPHDPPGEEPPADITKRNELHITQFTCAYKDDLSTWYAGVQQFDKSLADLGGGEPAPNPTASNPTASNPTAPPPTGQTPGPTVAGVAPNPVAPNPAAPNAAAPSPAAPNPTAQNPTAPNPTAPNPTAPNPTAPNPTAPNPTAPNPAAPNPVAGAPAAVVPPKGPGWVFTISGYHFHNSKTGGFGAKFLAETILKNLRQEEVPVPPEPLWPDGPKTFPLKKLGLGFPVLISVNDNVVDWTYTIPVDDPSAGESEEAEGGEEAKDADDDKPAKGGSRKAGRKAGADGAAPTSIPAPRYDFTIQFCWQVPPPDVFVEITHLYPGDQAMREAAAAGNEVAKAAAGAQPAVDEASAGEQTTSAAGSEPAGDQGVGGPAEGGAAGDEAAADAAAGKGAVKAAAAANDDQSEE